MIQVFVLYIQSQTDKLYWENECYSRRKNPLLLSQTLPGLHKEVLNWEQKYKESLSIDELRKKVATLKKEMAWALVYEEEKVSTFHFTFLLNTAVVVS